MILQALAELYENLAKQGKVAREGWCKAKVSYAVNLSPEGKITGIVSRKSLEQRGKKEMWLPTPCMVPQMVTRSSGVSANFLCDNSKYILGIDAEGGNPRVLDCFQAAKERHLVILQGVKGEMAQAVRLFFETWKPEAAMDCEAVREHWDDITDGGNLVFCMGAVDAQEDPSIQEAWEKARDTAEKGPEGICLVTGKRTEISRIHRTIKGVLGAQSSGAALVSFNAPAFESYGKEQSYNAPVGRYAEFAYTTALNYLLDGEQREYIFQLGDITIVFWAESGKVEYQEALFMSAFPTPDNQETIRGVFEDLKHHRRVKIKEVELDPDQNFCVLGLAPNAARLSARFFYQGSFGNLLNNLSKHYERMKVVRPSWEEREYLGIWAMLFETVNQKPKDRPLDPRMAAMTLKAILEDSRYPVSLYTDTLMRIRAEQGIITWGRAGIIKAYLVQNYGWEKGEEHMGLNQESRETAYVLGRLFAVLESIQMDANPGIKATIRDRYFNSACATPAMVFPVLIKLKNSHVKKLERDKISSMVYYEQLLMEITEKLTAFPQRLSLEKQGEFILGYYHQMQKRYEKKTNY